MSTSRQAWCEFSLEELPYKNKSAGKPNVHGGGIWLVSPMNA